MLQKFPGARKTMSQDSAKNITVALIEDDAGIRETMSAFLRQAPGFELRAAYPSAERALESLQQSVPEVVLMDELREWIAAFTEMSYQSTGHRTVRNPRIWTIHDLIVLTDEPR